MFKMFASMKHRLFIIVASIMMLPMSLLGQTYQTLWKQVEEAQQKDLPQTAIAHLQEIETKARKERAYGQLLKSTLLHSRLQAEVAPDSLAPAVSRLEQEEQAAQDVALKAVYDAVLSIVYKDNRPLGDDHEVKSKQYAERAMAHPEALAAMKTDTYVPFVVKGKDSELYGHDLLSVVGSELKAWQVLSDYYAKTGNRAAACLTALEALKAHGDLTERERIRKADSLIAVYGDLPEACEIAIQRYEWMDDDPYDERQYAEWLQQSLKRWGTWQRANSLRNSWAELTKPSFEAKVPHRVVASGQRQTIELPRMRHLQSLTLRVFRTQLKGDTELTPENNEDYRKLKVNMTELTDQRRELTFAAHEDYELFADSLQLGGLPVGVYLLEFSTQPQTSVVRYLYFVSDVRTITQPQPDETIRYVVVDATTGQPISGASIRLGWWEKSMKPKTLTTDSKGEAVYHYEKGRMPTKVYAYTSQDNYCPETNAYGRYTYYEYQYGREHTCLFTDRSIYRPGQTVHVTGVLWKEASVLENNALANQQVKIELRDANYKLVSEQTLTTDRYGKCATKFTLPTGQLNGRFTLHANNGSASIRVEEYKRPTFQVEFPEYKESYQNGDTVRAQAKAVTYAGVPVQGAKVKYTVRRQVAFWWMTYSWYWEGGTFGNALQKEIVNEGETVTADDGTFTVEMPMLLPKGLGHRPMFYHFVVEADVTDVAGETHSATLTLPLGNKPTALTCDVPQQVRSDQMPQVTFSRRNAAGQEIDGTVRYRIDGGKWQECAANSQCSILNSQLKSGSHRMEAVCDADSIDMTFVVFGLNDKKPATKTADWFYVSHQQFPADGSPVTVQVGSSDADVHIVYALFAGNKLIEQGAIDKSDALINRKLTYEEAYGNGLLLTYAWIKNGVFHQHATTIARPLPDKQLKMTWATFRDRLTPGQQEEWRLKIQNPDGTPADASLMAVLYDKSLDAIAPHQWSFSPNSYLSQPSTSWQSSLWGGLHAQGAQSYKGLSVRQLTYSHFEDSVYPVYTYLFVRGRGPMYSRAAAPMAMIGANAANDAADEVMVVGYAAEQKSMTTGAVALKESAAEEEAAEQPKPQEEVQLRENLNETAFCYPVLVTNEQGEVALKFTLPESLTTWRFMGVANTPGMCYGSIADEAVAKKDVMVQPNVPRFLRMGDEACLSARIFNTSERTVSGVAQLQLIDPECNQTVSEQELPFSVEAGKTGSVTFQFQPDETYSLLVYKVTVQGDGFSDGEQHYLPILPDREHVTKTVPYTQHEPGVKTIDLTNLFPAGTTQQKLTVEYTNNPAWLMVQALPIVGQPWEHSAIDQAASYYSNLLAKTLLGQNPQVKAVFEQWKQEGNHTSHLSPLTSHPSSLTAQLSLNQELKDLVLAETPWVWAADQETEQKQRLADFFDENGINNRLSTAVTKLKKLQNADGSFSWYPGMQGSTSITVAIEEMLVRLNQMAGEQGDIAGMQTKAFDYIGREMVDVVKELKQQEKKGHKPTFPSFTALRWLYLCALDGRALKSDVKAANDYLIVLLKKDLKNQTIYEKALTAIVLSKHGEQRQAAEYVQSLKEYSVYTEEMGRYYDTPRASYSWYDYKIPTEVAALEAIQTVTPADGQSVDEMRRWLLQEKRTQAWDTPINSVNAIWAFLHGNSKKLTPITHHPTVLAIDDLPIVLPQGTAGMGYVKTAISQPQGKTFTATKTSEGTSWGAVYAQFLQKTSDIEASQSGISVKREVMTANGQKLTANSLEIGDRIKVRITIDTTRDLDFVQVVDRRAACMEPVRQLSGYHNGAYVSPKDCATHYFYYGLGKGRHVIETEYYIDRAGRYETGTCTVGCAYAPEYRATAPSMTLHVK